LAHRSGVSLFVVLLAAYKALLYCYSGQEDISLCMPVAGRNRPETRKLIGYFNNLVLIRTSLQGNPTLSDLVNRVSQSTLGAFEHQALPLQQIAEALNIPGSVLGRAMFTLQNVPAWPTEMAGIRIVPLDIPEGISNFDLSLSMKMQNGNLLSVLRYKTDIFQATTIAQMLKYFQCLLHDLAAKPERHLSTLPCFTAAQRPATKTSTASEESAYVAPHTELEHTVATIWQTVLRRDRISVEANFFELGGRSLDLVQVRSKLHDEVHQDIPLRELLNRPTIRLLAHYLHQQRDIHQPVARYTHQRAQNQRRALQQQKEQMQRRRKSDG
jgi:non-ribosomal peptide synthetase component F